MNGNVIRFPTSNLLVEQRTKNNRVSWICIFIKTPLGYISRQLNDATNGFMWFSLHMPKRNVKQNQSYFSARRKTFESSLMNKIMKYWSQVVIFHWHNILQKVETSRVWKNIFNTFPMRILIFIFWFFFQLLLYNINMSYMYLCIYMYQCVYTLRK